MGDESVKDVATMPLAMEMVRSNGNVALGVLEVTMAVEDDVGQNQLVHEAHVREECVL